MAQRAHFDSPWKQVLNRFLPDFLLFCLPKLAEEIDWTKNYLSLDKELNAISRKQAVGKRLADSLFKVWSKMGEEIWLLLHIEVQGEKELNFPERLCIYNYRIFDLYQKRIVTLAIFTDNNPQWRPQSYERNSLYNQLSFQFFSIKLLDYKGQEERLEEDSNPFALVVWAHLEALKTKKQHEKRFHAKTKLTRALYRRGFKKDDIIDLFYFIDWILTLPDPLELQYTEIIEQLEEEKHMRYISSVERVWEKQALEKGRQEGRQEERQDIALKLIHTNLFQNNKICDITGLSLEVVEGLQDKNE